MYSFLVRVIKAIEEAPLALATFVMTFVALIFVRLTLENMLGLFPEHSFFYFFFEFTHTFLFFLCAFLIILPLVRYAGNIPFQKAANILIFGFFIILTPPIIDTFIFRGTNFWSFYAFDSFLGLIRRFFTLFGDHPDMGITYGVRIEIIIVTLSLGLYAYLKSKHIGKALFVSLGTYTLLFILGTFPAWLTLLLLVFQKSFLSINANDAAALFLAPENIFARSLTDLRSVLNVKMSIVYGALAIMLTGRLLFREYPEYFIALWKNSRLPQIFYHSGLLLLGIAFAFFFTDAHITVDFFHVLGIFLLLAAVYSAWLASVVVNDCYDIRSDAETNPSRPLIKNTIPFETYKVIGVLFFIASLILSGIMSFTALLLLLSYQSLAWIYSAPPFRLKRFFGLATLFAAAAGILVLVAGFLAVSSEHSLRVLPLPLLIFLFVAYALCLPVKDFKDIRGDVLDHVYTLPVILGVQKAKLILGSLLFILYSLSPLVLHSRALFFPALLFGGAAFWALQKSTADEQSSFAFRKLPGIILAITICYGLVIYFILF